MGKYLESIKRLDVVRVEPKLTQEEIHNFEYAAGDDDEFFDTLCRICNEILKDALETTSFDMFLERLNVCRESLVENGFPRDNVDTLISNRVISHAEQVMNTPGIHVAPESNAVALYIDMTHHYFDNEGISTPIAFWDTVEILQERQYDHRMQGYTLPLTYAEDILHGMGVFWDGGENDFEMHIDQLIHSVCITECYGFEEFMAEPDIDEKGRYSIVMYRNDKTFDDRTPHETMIRKFAELCLLPFCMEYNSLFPDSELMREWRRAKFTLMAQEDEELAENLESVINEEIPEDELNTMLIEDMADVFLATYEDTWPWVSELSVCTDEEYNLTRWLIEEMYQAIIDHKPVQN